MERVIQDKWKFKFYNLVSLVIFISTLIMYGWQFSRYVLGIYLLSLIALAIGVIISIERKRIKFKYEDGKKEKIKKIEKREFGALFKFIVKIMPIISASLLYLFIFSMMLNEGTLDMQKRFYFIKNKSGYIVILLLVSFVFSKFDEDEEFWGIFFLSLVVVPMIYALISIIKF